MYLAREMRKENNKFEVNKTYLLQSHWWINTSAILFVISQAQICPDAFQLVNGETKEQLPYNRIIPYQKSPTSSPSNHMESGMH